MRSKPWLVAVALFWAALAIGAPGRVGITPAAPAGINYPVHATVAPRDPGRLYVVEQEGRILTVRNGLVERGVFLDIHSKVRSGGEMGLLSVAFHPEFGKKGSPHAQRYFVNYTVDEEGLQTVIAEYEAGKAAERRLLTFRQPYSNHNGGQLAFGPDGYLYIGTGDGGYAGDPHDNGQNLKSFLGKMLRIDVNGDRPYAIPKDNPFASGSGGLKEIFAWGLRNPWRFSFDRKTGELFAADVGQNRLEEIDIIEKGANYGWRLMEGTECFKPATGCRKDKELRPPIHEYPRSDGISVTGGFVYRGKKLPALDGAYVFGDYGTGTIWSLRRNGEKWDRQTLLETRRPISSFAEDASGEILVLFHEPRTKPVVFRIGPLGG